MFECALSIYSFWTNKVKSSAYSDWAKSFADSNSAKSSADSDLWKLLIKMRTKNGTNYLN